MCATGTAAVNGRLRAGLPVSNVLCHPLVNPYRQSSAVYPLKYGTAAAGSTHEREHATVALPNLVQYCCIQGRPATCVCAVGRDRRESLPASVPGLWYLLFQSSSPFNLPHRPSLGCHLSGRIAWLFQAPCPSLPPCLLLLCKKRLVRSVRSRQPVTPHAFGGTGGLQKSGVCLKPSRFCFKTRRFDETLQHRHPEMVKL